MKTVSDIQDAYVSSCALYSTFETENRWFGNFLASFQKI